MAAVGDVVASATFAADDQCWAMPSAKLDGAFLVLLSSPEVDEVTSVEAITLDSGTSQQGTAKTAAVPKSQQGSLGRQLKSNPPGKTWVPVGQGPAGKPGISSG